MVEVKFYWGGGKVDVDGRGRECRREIGVGWYEWEV